MKIQGTVRILAYSCDGTIRNKKSQRQSQASELTINDHSRRRAPSLGHDVLGHARVVGRVGQTRLLDDQVVVDGDVEVPVLRRVNYLLVLPPLHLWEGGEKKWAQRRGFITALLWSALLSNRGSCFIWSSAGKFASCRGGEKQVKANKQVGEVLCFYSVATLDAVCWGKLDDLYLVFIDDSPQRTIADKSRDGKTIIGGFMSDFFFF